MNIRFPLLFIAICMLSCKTPKYKLTVHCQLDNKDIANGFNIYFLQDKNKLEAKINGNNLTLPALSADTATVVVHYKKDTLQFKGIDADKLHLDQNMNWAFKILTANFDQIASSLNLGQAKKIYIWEFHPQDHGEGIDITVPVYK